jgi:hypothetical protein
MSPPAVLKGLHELPVSEQAGYWPPRFVKHCRADWSDAVELGE